MKGKTKIICIALAAFVGAGCQSVPPMQDGFGRGLKFPAEQTICVLDKIPDKSEWRDRDADVRIQFSGDSAQYWIDGYRTDTSCCWTLHHVRHEPHHCVFLCDSPQAEWFVFCEGETLKVEKNSKGRKLPQSYTFTRIP